MTSLILDAGCRGVFGVASATTNWLLRSKREIRDLEAFRRKAASWQNAVKLVSGEVVSSFEGMRFVGELALELEIKVGSYLQ